jgi:excisionase family DNA binding protein
MIINGTLRRLLSPGDLARAIGVSESSLKRWVDAGRIRALKTEGGHRRIPLPEAIRFIRERRQPVLRPELLGFPEGTGAFADGDTEADVLQRDLEAGDSRAARARILTRYLEGESIASLCDGPLRVALERIGELWTLSENGIFVEHRATDACIQILGQLRTLVETPVGAPIALGATPSGDTHLLPSFMVATVLAAEGFDVVNLGADTPATALDAAIAHHAPMLVWISVTMPPATDVANAFARLVDRERAAGRAVIVGGRHIGRVPIQDRTVEIAASMRELAAFARGVKRARR